MASKPLRSRIGIALDNQGSNPDAETDEVVLFKKTTGSGGTGVFFKNQTDSDNVDELVSKKKAITFGLIFQENNGFISRPTWRQCYYSI